MRRVGESEIFCFNRRISDNAQKGAHHARRPHCMPTQLLGRLWTDFAWIEIRFLLGTQVMLFIQAAFSKVSCLNLLMPARFSSPRAYSYGRNGSAVFDVAQARAESQFDMLSQVDRLEIIAAIDAEIERLEHARLLIAQSGVEKPSNISRGRRTRAARAGKKQPFSPDNRSSGKSHAAGLTVIEEKPQVLVVRIPPRELPKRRVVQTAMKQRTALTGDIPKGPIAVAKNRERAVGAEIRTHSSMSAFGLAITRGLASLEA
jgi:hypothetical protein